MEGRYVAGEAGDGAAVASTGLQPLLASKSKPRPPKISHETIALIRRMARQNVLWGAERIRGEEDVLR
ncbi:MAG: hypothetical protein GY953_39705 [bacterium]|nr:hypothetical protein [bacterium]